MSMHKSTYIERILIVLHADGAIKGAHQESLTTIKDGDTVLASVQEPATALTAEALAQALPTQGAILAQLAAVTAERDALLANAANPAPTSPVASPAHVEAPAFTIPEAPLDVSPVAPPVEEPGVATVEALVSPPVVEEPAPAPTVVKEPEPTAEALLGEATGDAVSPLEADPAAGSI